MTRLSIDIASYFIRRYEPYWMELEVLSNLLFWFDWLSLIRGKSSLGVDWNFEGGMPHYPGLRASLEALDSFELITYTVNGKELVEVGMPACAATPELDVSSLELAKFIASSGFFVDAVALKNKVFYSFPVQEAATSGLIQIEISAEKWLKQVQYF